LFLQYDVADAGAVIKNDIEGFPLLCPSQIGILGILAEDPCLLVQAQEIPISTPSQPFSWLLLNVPKQSGLEYFDLSGRSLSCSSRVDFLTLKTLRLICFNTPVFFP
jgi:hypothetical protein